MASIPRCVNGGGPGSRLLLSAVPQLDQEIELGAAAVAVLRFWRARAGEIFTLVDPQQAEYRARIVSLGEDTVVLLPFAQVAPTESLLEIQIYQALPEKERFELILQKVTEIGASRIVPYTCQRSISLRQRDAGQKKSHRWPEILLRAAKQSRRVQLPELYPVVAWQQAIELAGTAELALLCYEGRGVSPLGQALQGFRGTSVALLIGPEGGFTAEEVEEAGSRGILPVGLGPRVLRTETAAIVAAGVVQFALGDLGRNL